MDDEIMQGAESVDTDSFMDGWEETSPREEELETAGGDQAGGEQQADQEEGNQGQEESGGDQAGQDQPPRTWELQHLGQVISASEADMVALANKGLDYDRVRAYNDEARPVMELFKGFAQKAGMDVPAYLAHIRAQAKQAEGLSEAEARRTVELEDREAVVAAQEAVRQHKETEARQLEAQRQQAEARRQADVREFLETFPEAAQDPQSIPPEVWAEVRGGRSLVAAYARYSAAQARAAAEEAQRQEAVRRQNTENAARSAGSMRSAGAEGCGDAFLEGWNE